MSNRPGPRGSSFGRLARIDEVENHIVSERHVGWSIIVNNLVFITRARKRKVIQDASQKLAA